MGIVPYSTVLNTRVADLRPAVTNSRPLSATSLRRHGTATALIAEGRTLTFADLADMVDDRRTTLGAVRQLVALEGGNNLEFVVTWLAALDGGHPVILLDGPTSAKAALTPYEPDVMVSTASANVRIEHLANPHLNLDESRDLHPDLALLMSTSGSTGASKLVRLSHDAVASNAVSIANYLDLQPSDRAITSIPLHYCYGLSVVSSHLAVGASVILTNTSVVDPCFWDAVERWGATGLSGVPYTFEMIERVGLDVLRAPSLRYVTQAGGRMPPEDVVRLAQFGQTAGWDLFVMYGQTEATARMAYLPPEAVFDNPAAIGQAIPGGSIRLDLAAAPPAAPPADDGCDATESTGIGEIVYTGPNVMMGYAMSTADLGRGHELVELRTGDLGRVNSAGYLEVVGRSSRFLKIHGKRIDLGQVESKLAGLGWRAACAGDDNGLVVAIAQGHEPGGATSALAEEDLLAAVLKVVTLPRQRVTAVRLTEIPRTTSGKVNGPALTRVAQEIAASRERAAETRREEANGREDSDTVMSTFRLIFGATKIDPGATFASLGGDSFSYVEMSIRLERVLGILPMEWHLTPVSELARLTPRPRRHAWTAQLEASVVIRAVAILLIVCTHMKLYRLPGGAHALLAVIGYNFARFQLLPAEVPHRLRRASATIARVAIPTSLWIGINMVMFGGYSIGALGLANNYFGSPWRRDGRWEYWYFETFVQVMIVLAVVFSIPAVRRLERRVPFSFAVGALALTLIFRFKIVEFGDDYNYLFRPHTIAFFIALGWCAQCARNTPQRLLVTALVVATTIGFFDQPDREWRIMVMIGALIWIPRVTLPRPIATIVGLLAAASMYIFLVHWQVWPLFTPWLDPRVALVATVAVGVGAWWLAERVVAAGTGYFRRRWPHDAEPSSALQPLSSATSNAN